MSNKPRPPESNKAQNFCSTNQACKLLVDSTRNWDAPPSKALIMKLLKERSKSPRKRSDGTDCWPPKHFDAVEYTRGNADGTKEHRLKPGMRYSRWLYYIPTLEEKLKAAMKGASKLHKDFEDLEFFTSE